jgi:hypothetical protein
VRGRNEYAAKATIPTFPQQKNRITVFKFKFLPKNLGASGDTIVSVIDEHPTYTSIQ